MIARFKIVGITTGDCNGIGLEVAAKALSKLKTFSTVKTGTVLILFRHHIQSQTQSRYFKLIDQTWSRKTFSSLSEALQYLNSANLKLPLRLLIDLALNTSEAHWVYEAALACKHGLMTSLVTGPLSKKLTMQLPGKPIGHTGIFRKIYPKLDLFMGFAGTKLNVLLATDHIPLQRVPIKLADHNFRKSVFNAAKQFNQLLGSSKKAGLLGLNPHSGEEGRIGREEGLWFNKLPKHLAGPLVPDAAFLPQIFNKYSFLVCLYHDQGLIPFKLLHGQDTGVHITIGLPFVRTSVDHGTAFDIYNKNLANENSMLDAIKMNLKLIRAAE